VTIDQLSFVDPDLIINPATSLNGSYIQMVSPPPHVNYVAFSPMPSVVDANDPLTVSSISYDLDLVVDMLISSVGVLEPDLLTPIATLDMCSFQSMFLPLSDDLLEARNEFFPLIWCPSRELFSWKPGSIKCLLSMVF
jgi:hypothetical protein